MKFDPKDLLRLKGRTVSVDFDGVLHSYTRGWTGFTPEDPPTPGAVDFVNLLVDAGVKVVISSCRVDTAAGLKATRKWLKDNGFPRVEVTSQKPPAVAYIDDRAVPFTGSWEQALAASAALQKGGAL